MVFHDKYIRDYIQLACCETHYKGIFVVSLGPRGTSETLINKSDINLTDGVISEGNTYIHIHINSPVKKL